MTRANLGLSSKDRSHCCKAGQGIGAVTQVQYTAAYVVQFKREYAAAKATLLAHQYAGV